MSANAGLSPVTLELGSHPGSLRIVNTTDKPIEIAGAITVDKQDEAGQWSPINTEFDAVAACATREAASKPVTLAAHAVLQVVDWRGESCGSQCEESCRANLSYLPGTFRFVVTVGPRYRRSQQIIGPSFHMTKAAD